MTLSSSSYIRWISSLLFLNSASAFSRFFRSTSCLPPASVFLASRTGTARELSSRGSYNRLPVSQATTRSSGAPLQAVHGESRSGPTRSLSKASCVLESSLLLCVLFLLTFERLLLHFFFDEKTKKTLVGARRYSCWCLVGLCPSEWYQYEHPCFLAEGPVQGPPPCPCTSTCPVPGPALS